MICDNFAYSGLMKFFEEISQIPRPTFHEGKIADYLCNFARERKLEYYRDESNNVFIKIAGSKGRENEAPILLQGHTDMVCEKNEGVEHDFLTQGIKLVEKDGWIRADGTTLGADNGVAVATMLYILDGAENNIMSHPPIECLFTVAEEVGMNGAYEFDCSKISARRMINMDSADESLIIAGCTGGQRLSLIFTPEVEKAKGKCFKITVKGLAGGHSGEDIHRGRANANKLMGRVLLSLSNKIEVRLSSIRGGNKDNAIPREATAFILTDFPEQLLHELKTLEKEIAGELCADDANFTLRAEESEAVENMLTKDCFDKVVFLLSTVANGVFDMNHDLEGIVEFSRNFGVIRSNEDSSSFEFVFSARSSKPSRIKSSNEQLELYARLLGMELKYGVSYPGWIYSQSSQIRDAYVSSFFDIYKKEPEITAIHAGLECGIIKQKIPDMDIISCGPVIVDLHSPNEALNIKSFESFFAVIIKILEK